MPGARLAAAAFLGGGPVPGPDARDAARRLLRRAEYHRDDPSLVDKAVHWVLDRLDWLLRGGSAGHAMLVLLLVLAAVVVFAVVRAGPPRRGARRGAGTDPLSSPLAAADHRRRAEELAAQGRHAEAMREWLRAAVRTIEDRGVLTPRPGRTGAATAREAGRLLPSAAADLQAATTAFDEVWFGGRPAAAADVALARAAADGVLAARLDQPAAVAAPW